MSASKLNRRRRKRGLPTRRTTLCIGEENMAWLEAEAERLGDSLSLVLDRILDERRMAGPAWTLEQIAANLSPAAAAADDQIEL
jgi:hypothetical protein